MKEEVFHTLIEQLKEMNFDGLISPHLYGEPMSDPRMPNWIKHIRNNLPDVKIKIVTNGDYLNKQTYKNYLESGVNIFYISKHSRKLKKPCRELLEELPASEKIELFYFKIFIQILMKIRRCLQMRWIN